MKSSTWAAGAGDEGVSLASFQGESARPSHRYTAQCLQDLPSAADRNDPGSLYALGFCKLFTGPISEVIPLEEQAIRLSPRSPYIALRYLVIGMVHLLQSRTDEAILWLEKARSAYAAHPGLRIALASAYGLKGETERAAAELGEARRLAGEGSFASIAKMKAAAWSSWSPKTRALYEGTYYAGLRNAGVPEE